MMQIYEVNGQPVSAAEFAPFAIKALTQSQAVITLLRATLIDVVGDHCESHVEREMSCQTCAALAVLEQTQEEFKVE